MEALDKTGTDKTRQPTKENSGRQTDESGVRIELPELELFAVMELIP